MAGKEIDMNISVKVDDAALKKLVRDSLKANQNITKAFNKSGISMATVAGSRHKALVAIERINQQSNSPQALFRRKFQHVRCLGKEDNSLFSILFPI